MEKTGVGKTVLSEEIKLALKDAAKKLTGSCKRDFTAKVTEDYLAETKIFSHYDYR